MTYLLDTHILIWVILEPQKISARVKEIITNPKNKIIVSSISFWEISIKYALGKFQFKNILPEELIAITNEMDFVIEDLSANTASSFYNLTAAYHKDPFDRMLIWQAIQNNYTLISNDKFIKKYTTVGLKVIS